MLGCVSVEGVQGRFSFSSRCGWDLALGSAPASPARLGQVRLALGCGLGSPGGCSPQASRVLCWILVISKKIIQGMIFPPKNGSFCP